MMRKLRQRVIELDVVAPRLKAQQSDSDVHKHLTITLYYPAFNKNKILKTWNSVRSCYSVQGGGFLLLSLSSGREVQTTKTGRDAPAGTPPLLPRWSSCLSLMPRHARQL